MARDQIIVARDGEGDPGKNYWMRKLEGLVAQQRVTTIVVFGRNRA